MKQDANELATVPSHYRQFLYETSPTKSNDITKQQRRREIIDTPRSSPPRFRLSLRSALRDIISKDWDGLALHAQPRSRMASLPRPDPVRMKDSDDYITERAANPRTGLISPSLGTITPCRESTPQTPGDALKLRYHDHASPTPDPRRVLFSRANEGRKISAGSNGNQCTPDEYGWHYDGAIDEGRAGTPCSTLPEDRLVVHMPSAKEPQPFAYPGYSSEQIEAFEHYRHKARRVSNEGYDQRLLQTSRNASSTYSTLDHEQSPDENNAYPSCSRQGHQFRPYNGLHKRPEPQLIVRKRSVAKPACQAGEAVSRHADPSERLHVAKTSQGTLFNSTKTMSNTNRCTDQHNGSPSRTVVGAHCASKHAQLPHAISEKISKKSCMAPRRGSVHNGAKGNHDDKNNAYNGCPKADSTVSDMTDLRTLPRVTLVRPEHAAIPVSRGVPQMGEGGRKCSLGCRRNVSGQCLDQRKVSLPVPADRLFSAELSKPDTDAGPVSAEKAEEVLVGILAWLLCYIKGIRMPQSDLIETLRSADATSKEKADALKAALSLAGHVLAVGTALAMIWQLSAAVIHLLQIALWPLVVPFRILRWLMGAA